MSNMREVPVIPISAISFDAMTVKRADIVSWRYPKRDLSRYLNHLSGPQYAALMAWGWVAILMVPAGLILSFVFESWWWALLVPGAYLVWKANRQSMEQFFIENLQTNAQFYDAIRQTPLGDKIGIVLKE